MGFLVQNVNTCLERNRKQAREAPSLPRLLTTQELLVLFVIHGGGGGI